MTIETTYSRALKQLKSLMDLAVEDREVIVVRRRTGGDVAMIAADELDKLSSELCLKYQLNGLRHRTANLLP